MRYIFTIRTQAEYSLSVEEKHDKFISCFKKIKGGLGMDSSKDYPPPTFKKNDFTATFSLTRKMTGILNGFINYRFRSRLEDVHSSDDYMYIVFSPKKIEFAYLLEVAHNCIEELSPYSLLIYPEDIIFSSYYAGLPFETTSRLNYRKDIKIFYPLMYMDKLSVERTFKYDPLDLCRKLNGHVQKVELFNEGVFIQGSDNYATVEECLEFNERMQRLLDIKVPYLS